LAIKDIVNLRVGCKLENVTVTIGAGTATTSNAANAKYIGGMILGIYPSSANTPDKYLKTVSISSAGVITVTLSGNSTAEMVYQVVVAYGF
jgi:hypothetical protein